MGVAFFYHLTQRPLEATLPMLLTKAQQVGWRVAVRGRDDARMKWLDEKLWLGPEDGFLAHGLAGRAHEADQPVLLTTQSAMPNGAVCLMAVDGAGVAPGEVEALERVCILFDGNDSAALDVARGQWRELTGAGCKAQYWSEDSGRWEMRAEA
ncbi:MAG: DNA polymerase III subunit chi [Roseovarius sp.]|nr:DNA polymerase III subunit chi [Roseovarius sp.]